jgi:hypothetical protein
METYFSVDVAADGPIPGPYSMISVGVAVAGTRADRVDRCPVRRGPPGGGRLPEQAELFANLVSWHP